MADWHSIDTAPRDGTVIRAAKEAKGALRFPYPLDYRFEDGCWKAKFDKGWSRVDPQPTHWKAAERLDPAAWLRIGGDDADA